MLSMMAHVIGDGLESDSFSVRNGVKQGCVFLPTLFSILFSVVLMDAFKSIHDGVEIEFRVDGGVFNGCHFQAKTRMRKSL